MPADLSNGLAPPPVWQDDPAPTRAPRNQREWRLQAFADRFIDTVVLQPMFTSGIDAASQTTDNARTRAAARGIKFGLPDAFIAQSDGKKLSALAFIEYKRGTGLTARQSSVHGALHRAGVAVFTASTIADVLDALRIAGFRLHGNAANLASESEERLKGADRAAELKSPRKPSKPRARKPTMAQVRRSEAARVLPR